MLTVIYIAVFGALGCVARYFLSGGTHEKLAGHYSWGTLSVNVVGAFIIGLVMELGFRGGADAGQPAHRPDNRVSGRIDVLLHLQLRKLQAFGDRSHPGGFLQRQRLPALHLAGDRR